MTELKKVKRRTFQIRLLSILFASIILFAAGCQGQSQSDTDSLVLTVDGNKVYMKEMMYHVMLEKMQGELYASFMGSEVEDYWKLKTDNGKTMSEAAKDQAIDNAIRYEIFYQRALRDKYTLTEEEKKAGIERAENILKNMPSDQLSKYGFTKEKLIELQDKISVATIYYNQYVESLVDKEAIKAGIDPEKYINQYDIEYIYGNTEQKDKVTKLLEKAEADADFSELVKDTGLNSGKQTFFKGDNTFGDEDNLEGIITAMKAGQVSGLVETVKGYYIIKLKDDSSHSAYEKAVNDAVEAAVSKAFDEKYDELKAEHNIKINKKVWNKITIGS